VLFADPLGNQKTLIANRLSASAYEVGQEFRAWIDATDEEAVPRACAGDVEKLALGFVHVVQYPPAADLASA
jgi:hypothetical protein